MFEVQGKYCTAKVYTDNCEQSAVSQIINLCNQPFAAGSNLRMMPDVHAGAGCTIGTTMLVTDKVVPNLVGVDVGCGMYTTKLKPRDMDFAALDSFIHENIPAGMEIRNKRHPLARLINLEELRCKDHVNLDRAYLSIGSLGGGNHFIEVDVDNEGYLYLVVHTGSRYLGKQIAEYYQNLAWRTLSESPRDEIAKIVKKLKEQGRQAEISAAIASSPRPKYLRSWHI